MKIKTVNWKLMKILVKFVHWHISDKIYSYIAWFPTLKKNESTITLKVSWKFVGGILKKAAEREFGCWLRDTWRWRTDTFWLLEIVPGGDASVPCNGVRMECDIICIMSDRRNTQLDTSPEHCDSAKKSKKVSRLYASISKWLEVGALLLSHFRHFAHLILCACWLCINACTWRLELLNTLAL